MKKFGCIVLLTTFSITLFAQNKVVVKVEIKQEEKLSIETLANPIYEGDNSGFDTKGGTPPYSYEWKETDPDSSESYQVTVRDNNNCTQVIYVNLEGSNIESIENSKKYVYPNPTSDIINVPIPENEESVTIRLIEQDGRLLYEKVVKNLAPYYQLSLSSCQNGLHYIQVAGNETKTYSVIKN